MKKLLSVIVVYVFCVSLGLISGCNTVKGIGRDVASGGRDIQRVAS